MQLIENHNAIGLCEQKYCSIKEKYFEIINLMGMEIFIVLCEKHMNQWEVYRYEKQNN